jgi:uncharacterized protein (DUF1800 family)
MSSDGPTSRSGLITRRQALDGLALAGLGALLAACRGRSEQSVGLSTPGALTGGATPPPLVSLPPTAASPTPAGASAQASTAMSRRALYGQLLRRAGFGAAPGELDQWLELSWSEAVDRLVDYDSIDNQALEDRLAALKLDLSKAPDIQRWWLLRMAFSARPLEEKMTLFWHGLLTSSLTSAKPEMMLTQNKLLRAHALDNYGTLLKAISRDPAMMRWLNLAENKKGHANENYARELMELFTMGPGNYTEDDVRESARAFTGLVVRPNGETVLVPAQHDNGQKTFLGRTGNFGPDEIIDIILEQPATPTFLATKLLRFFVAPNPTQASIDAVAASLSSTRFDMRAAMRTLLNLPELQVPSSYRALIKSPAELVAGTLRQLAIETDAAQIPKLMVAMGQILFDPPNVAGWPGGSWWLNSGTWLARLNFANLITASRSDFKLDPAKWPGSDGGRFIDGLITLLVDGELDDAQRQVLSEFAGIADPADTSWFDGQGRATIYLMLGLPEYHLS